jgi:hypothetical protein
MSQKYQSVNMSGRIESMAVHPNPAVKFVINFRKSDSARRKAALMGSRPALLGPRMNVTSALRETSRAA